MMTKMNCIGPIVQVEIQALWRSPRMCAHKFHRNKVIEN
jgi:hypothetical protein